MNSKLVGGILLVIGTTIGAGMLALPVATAELGFWGSFWLLIGSWAVMTACAFLLIEVNLWLPPKTNLISMAGLTLGAWAQVVAWVLYLVLLYSLISAYIAGGGDLLHYLLQIEGYKIPLSMAAVIFTAIFATIVYKGIRSVDYVNRGLMTAKMGAYLVLILLIVPFISIDNLTLGHIIQPTTATSLTVTAVAFGSLMIIPSLRTYFGDDVKSLRKAVFIGMFIPLVCYILWDMVIKGVVPLNGELGLRDMLESSSSNSDLITSLASILQSQTVTMLAKFFSSICMTTSFLSISLSLSDFLADGLKREKVGKNNLLIYGATFIPPLVIVIFYPDAFIRSLNYAGICTFVLMVILPPLMVWRGRYNLNMSKHAYTVAGGKPLLVFLMVLGVILVGFGLLGRLL